MRLIVASALLSAALVTPLASAQEQHGAVEGTVQDGQRAVLPGATVAALNLAKGVAVATVADATGTFRFPALAPGYYDVTASMPGFAPLQFERVEVLLGQVKRLAFVLDISGIAEEVRVSPSSPLVDTRQSARGFSLREDAIDLLPKGRDFTTLVRLAPGANEEPKLGGLSIDGASASENRFVVNGVETTDLITGVSGHGVLPEFVDEIRVKSSGYTAEYGGSTGGVINVVTKSGTNTWRGDVLLNMEADALDGGRRPTLRRVPTDSTRAEYVTYPEDAYTRLEPGFAVGGPLKRDRAWLFAAYQPALIHTERTVTFSFDGLTATKASDQTAHRFNVNQTTQLHDKLRTRATLDWTPSRRDGMLPALDGATFPQGNFDVVEESRNYAASANADWIATPRIYVGLRAGYFTTNRTTANVIEQPLFVFMRTNIGFLDVPAELQQVGGFQTDLSNDVSRVDRLSRVNAQADATYFGTLGGQHALKGGLQVDRRSNDVDNRLTVNAGLRTENETVPFYSSVGVSGVEPIHFSAMRSTDGWPRTGPTRRRRSSSTRRRLASALACSRRWRAACR